MRLTWSDYILVLLISVLGCDDAKRPTNLPTADMGSSAVSGSYNPDGVVAVITGQVLLESAAEGRHGNTSVAVRGYSSTAVTNAEGRFRLELILSDEDVIRSDETSDGAVSVEVLLTHPGYAAAESGIGVIPGGVVALSQQITLEFLPSVLVGHLGFSAGLPL
jgi:hypothetical protein